MDGQAIEDPPALGDVRDAATHDGVRGHAGERLILERHRAARRHEEPRDGPERRRLAGAVVPEERHDLTRAHFERHTLERGDLAVGDVDVVKT